MEPSLEAAQLPARLLRAVGAAAEARQPKSGGDGGAVDPAGTAHDETLRFSDTVAGVRLDPADHAALALLELQRRQRSQGPLGSWARGVGCWLDVVGRSWT